MIRNKIIYSIMHALCAVSLVTSTEQQSLLSYGGCFPENHNDWTKPYGKLKVLGN
jgi:hypothetical protein